MRVSVWPLAVRRAAWERCGGVCEWCGHARATQLHHRLYRSRGGLGLLVNAAALCGSGNHTGCHGRAHSKAGEDAGWSVRVGQDPAVVPVLYRDLGLVRLQPDGMLLPELVTFERWGDVS